MSDALTFRQYFRMTSRSFEKLLSKVGPLITKTDTLKRPAISPALKLSLTVGHLATGETHASLHFQYRLGRSTISYAISEVTTAIKQSLLQEGILKVNLF